MKERTGSRNGRKAAAAAVMICLLLICALAGCEKDQGNKEQDRQVNLNMIWWGNEVRDLRTQRVLELYQKENENVTIEGKSYPEPDYWEKMEFHAAGKTMPDLVQMGYDQLNSYVEKDILLDLTPYIESGALDVSDIPEDVLELGKSGDGIYGIAAGINAYCLFYNKTVTDECGITMKDNMTYDEFVEIAKEVTEKTGYRANLCPIDGSIFMTYWARAEGIPITGMQVPVGSGAAYIPFFEILKTGIEEGWHLRPDYGDMTAVETDPMVYGSIPRTMAWCTVHGGSDLLTAFQEAAPNGVEIGITTIPTSDPQKSNFLSPSMFFSVSADTEHPDEAVAVINYLINSTDANDILLGERGIPVSTAVLDEITDKLPRRERESFEFVTNVVAPNCSEIDPASPDGAIELNDTLGKILEKIASGESTAEEAAEQYYDVEIRLWGAQQ